MKKIRRVISLIIAVIMACTCVVGAMDAEAAGNWKPYNVYDANLHPSFVDREMEDVAMEYSAALYGATTYNDKDRSSWYTVQPEVDSAPYDAGMITEDTHNAMVNMTNFYRWLMGCSKITGDYSKTQSLQAGALVRNFSWNHVVLDSDKPADMDDELWQQGADCVHNVLADGYTPQGAIFGWMNEGYNLELETWGKIGHRAVLMNMHLTEISYGYCGDIAIGSCSDKRNKENMPEFTAYPAPGYMPMQLVNGPKCVWTVEFNNEWFSADDVDTVEATIENLNTHEKWVCNTADETLRSSYGCLMFVQPDDYDEDGCYHDSYQVTISGVWDERDQTEARLTYRVDFFDIDQYAESRVTLASACRKYSLSSEMMTDNGLEAVCATLPDTVKMMTDSGNVHDVAVAGEWTIDKENSRFVNSVNKQLIPSRITDPMGYLDEVYIYYSEKKGDYIEFDTLDIVPNKVNAGYTVKIEAYRRVYGLNQVEIFKMFRQEDGSYIAEEKFDAIDAGVNMDPDSIGYTIETAAPEDSGTYLSVYYDQGWIDDLYEAEVFVCNTMSTLEVTDVKYDIDGNGKINLTDLVVMMKIMHGQAPVTVSADIDGNGSVNIFDLILVREYIGADHDYIPE